MMVNCLKKTRDVERREGGKKGSSKGGLRNKSTYYLKEGGGFSDWDRQAGDGG